MQKPLISKAKIDQLVVNFQQQTLKKEDWTHEAHLMVAIYFLKNFDFFDAICRLKAGIILLNKFHHTENNGHGGYHETFTIFWCKIIAAFIQLYSHLSLEELAHNFLHSPLANRALPFEFYDKDKILTAACRAVYFEETKKQIHIKNIEAILNT